MASWYVLPGSSPFGSETSVSGASRVGCLLMRFVRLFRLAINVFRSPARHGSRADEDQGRRPRNDGPLRQARRATSTSSSSRTGRSESPDFAGLARLRLPWPDSGRPGIPFRPCPDRRILDEDLRAGAGRENLQAGIPGPQRGSRTQKEVFARVVSGRFTVGCAVLRAERGGVGRPGIFGLRRLPAGDPRS